MPAVVNREGPRFRGFVDTDMGASQVGEAFHAGNWLSVGSHQEWTGLNSPEGEISFEGSNNSTNGTDGNWRPITIEISNQPDGTTNAGGELTDLTDVPWEWIRPIYTRAGGGAGAKLNQWFTGKGRSETY